MSTNKEIIKIETIKKLAKLFPDMTVVDLLDWIEYCKILSKEVIKNDNQKAEMGSIRYNR